MENNTKSQEKYHKNHQKTTKNHSKNLVLLKLGFFDFKPCLDRPFGDYFFFSATGCGNPPQCVGSGEAGATQGAHHGDRTNTRGTGHLFAT